MLRLALIATFAASFVAAQSVTNVAVGGSGTSNTFVFNPNNVTAKEGDVVQFVFSGSPGNHSITQSTFAAPCTPMQGGFDSGWVFVPEGVAENAPAAMWNLTITNATTPIWFYCKQLVPAPHCEAGMVGAINAPTEGNTFDKYQSSARGFQGDVGQGLGPLVGNGASASAIPGPLPSGDSYVGSLAPPSPSGGGALGFSSTQNGGAVMGALGLLLSLL